MADPEQNRYILYHSIVTSTVPLGLPMAEGLAFDYRFVVTNHAAPDHANAAWHTHATLDDGTPYLSMGNSPDGYWLDFYGYACFHVTPDGRAITCYPLPDASPATLEHLFLDQVMPRVLSLRGRLVLHGAVIVAGQAALAVVGESGQGKSTLAAGFWQAGCGVLSDDCVVLNPASAGFEVVPSYPGVRLWPDAARSLQPDAAPDLPRVSDYNRKVRWAAPGERAAASGAAALRAILLLAPPAPDDAIRLTPASGREALLALLGSVFRLEAAPAIIADEFERLGRLVETVACYHLAYPRAYDRLPEVVRAVQAALDFRPGE